ncbi:MAG: phenylalanine--tRNA ligase subunit beta [Parcubacteria group bacterium CG1_02_37_51]|uniref:Phenylalanine--tRNA ligase beta subunit n=2 Tax=Candidatus Komeiliibacteriota TaxID=1817908 RepID=A0A2M7RFB2_9BACT|nr:MAG: phenylalanine--tRNA ligase subunit beta [Parcubacteria group bacterium CG1_02_37_51]PIY95212.1 MAG: phenylalanine--tRNA ligase subunit beta [Candidatus Komeilibacteria bacterium CG_4_10_14_0_8_um_filter_37_78]
MQISLNWLKQYIDLPKDLDPQDMALKLTMSTVEVEEVIDLSTNYSNIIVGQIKEIVDHPDADKLKVCQVDIGQEARVSIVCGGSNLKEKMYCVVALPGALVRWHGEGDPVKLAEAKIRGVNSHGMICAASEVGLGHLFEMADEATIVDLGEGEWQSGQAIAKALKIDDLVLEIDNKSLTHRPDLWSHYGMAREVAAILQLPLKPLETPTIKGVDKYQLKVKVEDIVLCPRYQALVIDNIIVQESPMWLQNYLEVIGTRPINNIVDITNYVLFSLGQPLHAFDATKIAGDKIIVRLAKNKEKIVTLDGEERGLDEKNLVIVDSDKPIAIAGIMGGSNSEVTDKTKRIVIESANFNASNIRRSSGSLGLRTEASIRFEKSLDPNLTELAMFQTVKLIKECCPEAIIASKVYDEKNYKDDIKTIKFSYDWLIAQVGTKIEKSEVIKILEALQFAVKNKGDQFEVLAPSWRATKDISLPEDIVEEVARIYGYDRIPDDLPTIKMSQTKIDLEKQSERIVKQLFAATFGFNEVYNYSWQSEDLLAALKLQTSNCWELKNYLSPEQRYLRTSLLPNLLKNLADNLRWYKKIKIFELGRVYLKEDGKYALDQTGKKQLAYQPKYLSCLIADNNINDVFSYAKGLLAHLAKVLNIDLRFKEIKTHDYLIPGQALAIYAQDELLGHFGVVNLAISSKFDYHSLVGLVEIDFSAMIKYIVDKKSYQPLPKYPVVVKDFSVILSNDVKWQELQEELLRASKYITSIELFDRYHDRQNKEFSIAFHVNIYNPDKTFTTVEIKKITDKLQEIIINKFKLTIKQ